MWPKDGILSSNQIEYLVIYKPWYINKNSINNDRIFHLPNEEKQSSGKIENNKKMHNIPPINATVEMQS